MLLLYKIQTDVFRGMHETDETSTSYLHSPFSSVSFSTTDRPIDGVG